MKYLSSKHDIITKQDGTKQVTLFEKELATPKNLIDDDKAIKAFENGLASLLESVSLEKMQDEKKRLVKAEKDASDMDTIISIFEEKRTKGAKIAKDDMLFFKALVWAVCGIPKGKEFSDADNLYSLCKKAFHSVKDNKAINKDDMQTLKSAFDTFCNKYLVTKNTSGIFKNYHVEYKTSHVMQVVTKLEKRVKWTAKGMVCDLISANDVCLEILRTALQNVFDFDATNDKYI